MYALIRNYREVPGLARKFAQHRSEIERTISRATGFVAFYLVDLPDGSLSITLCRGKEGVEEARRLGSDWLQENMPELAGRAPYLASGEVVIEVDAGVRTNR